MANRERQAGRTWHELCLCTEFHCDAIRPLTFSDRDYAAQKKTLAGLPVTQRKPRRLEGFSDKVRDRTFVFALGSAVYARAALCKTRSYCAILDGINGADPKRGRENQAAKFRPG